MKNSVSHQIRMCKTHMLTQKSLYFYLLFHPSRHLISIISQKRNNQAYLVNDKKINFSRSIPIYHIDIVTKFCG